MTTANPRRGGRSLEEQLEALQDREAELLEREPTNLGDICSYWEVVKRQQLLFTACGVRGIRRVGGVRVPPTRVSEQEAKDAILMVLLCRGLQGTQWANLPWSLGDFSPVLYRQPPEGLKRGGRSVSVVYCDDPMTETVYPYWTHILQHDPRSGSWTELSGGQDGNGLWSQAAGGERHYHTLWRDEGRRHCPVGRVTWKLGGYGSPGHETPEDLPELSPPVHESTRTPQTPSPPQLSRYSSGAGHNSRSRREPPSPGPSTAPPPPKRRRQQPPQRPQKTPRPDTGRKRPDRQPARPRGKGTARRAPAPAPTPVPPTPAEVGSSHRSDHSGATPLERLLQEAKDPPAVCYTGRTGQLKTIRHRIQTGSLPYGRVSSTWHWLGDSEQESKLLVTFDGPAQRDRFLANFKTGASGVRVQLVSILGL
nr:E2 protein [Anas platyrhynchos papillomavirus 3]